MNYLVVFIGCGAGGVARYALTRFASEHVASAIPLGTLAVNLIGSFAIGFLFAAFENRTVPAPVRLLLTTGFLGGFTTFSTYALDTALFFQARDFQIGRAHV